MYAHPDAVRTRHPDDQMFLCFVGCISVKTSLINTKLGNLVNLGVLFLTMWINSCLSHNLRFVSSPFWLETRKSNQAALPRSYF